MKLILEGDSWEQILDQALEFSTREASRKEFADYLSKLRGISEAKAKFLSEVLIGHHPDDKCPFVVNKLYF
jgi:hypothetical protein